VEGIRRRVLSNVTASVTLLQSLQKNICGIPRAIGSCMKKKKMKTDRYCSLVVHLLRGKELGFRNALTGNAIWCTKHETLQMYHNINGCDIYFYDRVYSYLATYYWVIRGSRDQTCSEFWPRMCTYNEHFHVTYMFNIVKECEDIYIEIRSYLDWELQMTIDAKKIIPKLSVPLEDKKLKKLKKYWGALIRETFDDIIYLVGYFTNSA